MEKFTEKKTVRTFDADYENATEVAVTNDGYRIFPGDPYVAVAWRSDSDGRDHVEIFDEEDMPTDAEIAELVRKSERAEYAYVE